MTRRIVDREYAIEECDEVCQDINTRDRYELRQRTNRNCGCRNETEVIRRGNRTSGQECEVEDIPTNCNYQDPCRCGCRCEYNNCGCRYNRCGYNRRGCGCYRGLNCDRNRRLRSCHCECEE